MVKAFDFWWGGALLVAGMAVPAIAGGEGWTTDYEAAREEAEREGKDLLLDFTGSDWCGWCIRLQEEVFGKEEFRERAGRDFVLVELDYPRAKELPEALVARNERLSQEFGIEGFPTIFLTDARGRPYARTGYRPGGVGAYLEHLDGFAAQKERRDDLLASAAEVEGFERARRLDAALTYLTEIEVEGGYADLVQQIIGLDPDDEAGLWSKYSVGPKLEEIERDLLDGRLEESIEAIDEEIAKFDPKGEIRQNFLFLKARAYFELERVEESIATLREAQAAAPDSDLAEEIPDLIEPIGEE
jgi:thiol-disulfide isomerase/thioredoxin